MIKIDFLKNYPHAIPVLEKLYLFAFDPTLPAYYERLGWRKIGMDEFKSHHVTVMEIGL
jgi:hypothetical protein